MIRPAPRATFALEKERHGQQPILVYPLLPRKSTRERGKDLPARGSLSLPGNTSDLGVAATAEALTADSRYAGLVAQAGEVGDALGGFAGLV